MSNPLTIVCSAKMGFGTFEAKFHPLVRLDAVGQVIVLRKEAGPEIPNLRYVVLPKLCKFPILNLLITPILLTWTVWKTKADLILAYHYIPHFYFAYIASVFSGRPYILGQTGSDDQLLARRPFKGVFLRHILNNALQMNVPGKNSLEFWEAIGIRRVRALHSTIDTDYYVPSAQAKAYDFVYTGRLEDYKGVDLMIEAANQLKKSLPDFRFAIVGYGSGRQRYETTVKNYGLENNVFFMGFQSDIRMWLQKSRIFIMASDCEGLPCALMEAMSCGMVCLTSLVGNIGDLIIEGETGFSFLPRDKQRMVELMMQLYHQEPAMHQIKERARALVIAEHSYRVAQDLWTDALRGIVNKN
jgi:glycosyltransferase involved in cell wall biosynthesis